MSDERTKQVETLAERKIRRDNLAERLVFNPIPDEQKPNTKVQLMIENGKFRGDGIYRGEKSVCH